MKNLITVTKKLALLFVLILSGGNVFSQFVLNAEVRPRAEFRNGFKSLAPDSANPNFAISQRTRFNLSYNQDKLSLFISFQDVRTWGDRPQLNSSDLNGPAIHQAWAQYQITESIAVKLGRQEIIYDNHRFFGNVGWAQQARSHDLAMFKYKKNNLKVDLGLAYNQDGVSTTGNRYITSPSYKSMQYIWAHNDWDNLGVSVLVLNNGLQYYDNNPDNDETRYSQTFGTYITGKVSDVKLAGTFYYQMGKDVGNNSMSAYLLGLDANWAPEGKNLFAGLGFEMQSGNDLNWKGTADSTTNKAFAPMYGTNHKFNGYMDYFYVGNHFNTVGLVDVYASVGYKFKKSKIVLAVHNFMSSGSLLVNTPTGTETKSSQLGTEFDLVYVLPMSKMANLKVGYSHMLASESMELIKSTGSYDNLNNWAWVMVTFKPELFKHEYKKSVSPVK